MDGGLLRFETMQGPEVLDAKGRKLPNLNPFVGRTQNPGKPIDGYLQAGPDGILIDQNGRVVYYSMYLNDVFEGFVEKYQLNDPAKLRAFDPNSSFPVDSLTLPWHTDYNSCATHLTSPNPAGNNALYWSWPAERPVSSHPAALCQYDEESKTWQLGKQLYSVRGVGTETDYPAQAGRYQQYLDFVHNWEKVGFVIQGTQISVDGKGKPSYGPDLFLEVSSLFATSEDTPGVPKWPTANVPAYPGS